MKRSVKIFWQVFFGGFIAFILLILLASWGMFGPMPSLKKLENPSILQATDVFADDGTLMGKYYLEKGNRSNVEYKDISKYVLDALVATEDKRFYNHSGIDFKGTLRAVMLLGSEGGGSTLTQQLAKALLDHERKSKAIRVIQKLKEWIIAVKLERNFTKDELLALYLNAVPFSDNVFGIRNASKTFFQKEPYQLNIEESALLVGMINGPGLYNPRRNPKASMDRRNLVINRMAENGKISSAEATKCKTQPIKLNYRKLDENSGYAPYFREVLREDLKTILKDIKKPDGDSYDIYDDGLKIYTTINTRMQEYAEESIAEWMPTMQKYLNATGNIKNGKIWEENESKIQQAMKSSDRWDNMKNEGFSDDEIKRAFKKKVPMKVFAWNAKREKDTIMSPYDSIKYHKQVMQASFMAMDPVTGEIKAWVGGVNFKTFKYDHVNIRTKRQVGSSIKPFLYAQAIEERGFSPETPVEDVQQDFGSNRLVPATSKSCTGRTMTMASALAFSKNCASAYIMKQVTPKAFEEFVSRIGIPTDIGAYPANALGACDLSLYEMLWGYTVFAGRGFSTKPWYISRIEDRNGNVIKRFDYSVNRKEAINEITSYKMVRMMQGTVDIGTAAGLRNRLGAAEMGGKTGTTNDNSDAWFMGYTPQLLAGVWVGCDDRFVRLNKNDTRGYGGTAARPIWEAFYKKVYADKKLGIDRDARFSKPEDLEMEMNSADPLNLIDVIPPAAEGEDQGVGNESDFEIIKTREYIGPESKPVIDDSKEKDRKKDTTNNQNQAVKIGEPQPEEKKKKGIFNKIFGKKDKKGD
ncbi:MAG TPA: transglycosylase domain-containing protein [Chitinophagaceae bacterium]|nr:transglycosylase domain-containing protein [Chitinophagaceae bacterium]